MIIGPIKDQREHIVSILSAENLPVDDLPQTLDNFLVATDNGQLMGIIGLEIYGSSGLLRSLAVLPEYRNQGIADKLVKGIESLAYSKNLKTLFLLTETAPEYFARKQFLKIPREEVPDEVKQSSEFSHVCPVSAIVMKKNLG